MADVDHTVVVPVNQHASNGAMITSMEQYQELYNNSVGENDEFWKEQASKLLTWHQPFDEVQAGTFQSGDLRWFVNGRLNACYNCLDRHVYSGKGDKVCLIWEQDEVDKAVKLSYLDVFQETCKVANVMKKNGVKKGDVVTIYMPMCPEIVFTMLACARIGAPHSVVFAGFSAEALRERIIDCQSKFIFTCESGTRGGREIALKKCVDDALDHANMRFVEKVFVYRCTKTDISLEVNMEEEMKRARPYCAPEMMDSEDDLFFLYTSGSTGKPKGLVHTTGGYLVYAALTHRVTFDLREDDVYACVADCGWITGHSYIVYGPLLNNATTVLFESTPLYPDHNRYWRLVEEHKVTQFYTAPTAIRALMRHAFDDKHDLSSLRILGSVGEPINPEAWKWYHCNIGKNRCALVDTYWQTENGGFLITPLPGATPMKPGSASFPFLGIKVALKDCKENEKQETVGMLCIEQPWPGLARTINNDHERYLNTYFRPYDGCFFTGDACIKDKDGYIWVTGRVDDVLNVSGHRLGSAEVENALVGFDAVSEAAVIGIPHEVKGEGIGVFVILKKRYSELLSETEEVECEELILMRQSLKNQVRSVIGPIATPDLIVFTNGLPKTRSGKIMRRVLRKLILKQPLGDVSTMADSSVVEDLQRRVEIAQKH